MTPASLNANRVEHQRWAADKTVLAADDPDTTAWVAAKTNYTIYVTHLSVSTTTDSAATMTFQDTASTPVVIAKTVASPGVGFREWNFGEDGTPLTADKALDIVGSAAGLGARVHAEGYYKQSATLTA